MTSERDNFKAGLFVIAGIIMAMAAVWLLVDFNRLFEQTQTVTVHYTLSDGLQGLKEGASVTVGDQPVGEVIEITDHSDGQRVTGKLISFILPKRYTLYKDASIVLSVPAIGTGTKLNVRSVGNQGLYEEGEVLEGDLAGTTLTRNLVQDMGIEDLQRQQLQQIIANVEAITTTLRADLPAISQKVQTVLEDLQPLAAEAKKAVADAAIAIADAKAMVADAKARSGEWFDRIDSIATNADETMTIARDLVADKDPTIRESLDNVKAATADVKEVTARVKSQTMDQVTEAIAIATRAVENIKVSTDEIRDLVIGQRPVLERALANAQLTTDQLKLAAIEVRRSPWRLLYKPSDTELDSDNLYDAARSFAQAAGALDSAALSLRAVSERADRSNEELTPMLEHLEVLFGEYQKAESRFWEALEQRAPAP